MHVCMYVCMLRKRLHLKTYKLSIVQGVERWITPATQQQLEYHCKALFEPPCITSGRHIEP
jgi:hypothetical protein